MGVRTLTRLHKASAKPPADAPRDWSNRWQGSVTAGATSFVVHLVLLLILACLLLTVRRTATPDVVTLSFEASRESERDEVHDEVEGQVTIESPDPFAAAPATAALVPELLDGISAPNLELEADSSGAESDAVVILQPMLIPLDREGQRSSERSGGRVGVRDDWNFPSGVGFEGRRPGNRTQLALLNGGTLASERAVDAGLEWLARHQDADGSWSFQHLQAGCGTACTGPGTIDGSTAATGLALLCFLGAGATHHDDGPWRDTVQRGLEWLKDQSRDGDLRCSRTHAVPERHTGMYAQGIATMALCEAHGMTHDRIYWKSADEAVQFIVRAQDRVGGGWRYDPNEPGDTSVLGWQVLALVSARMSGLDVPDPARENTVLFLESVYDPATNRFGYTGRSRSTWATTAIGQLCSMYLRSSLPPERLRPDVSQLAATNPVTNNAYANYYIAQVLFQFGDIFQPWNERLRDHLVRTQRSDGHAAGSWNDGGQWSRSGGRLYTTAMNVLSLEVYYRHLPLYHSEAFDVIQPELATRGRRNESMNGTERGRRGNADDEPAKTLEPIPAADPLPEVVSDFNVPPRYILNYPAADRFCGPIQSTFEDAERDSVVTDRGRRVGQHRNGGFGLSMLQVGDQTFVHTGADYGWYQAGESVNAVAAGIVRISADPALLQMPESSAEDTSRPPTLMDWGSMIVIEHRLPDGQYLTSLYAHLGLDRRVRVGDIVAAGQQIGTIGRRSATVNGGYEPHLHFGIREGRIAETGATLFTIDHDAESLAVKLHEAGEQTMTIRFPDGADVPDGVDLFGRDILLEHVDEGLYRIPSWYLWQTVPPEARLAGYLPDLDGWIDPTLFLREHQATVLPASRFSMTLDEQPSELPNITGEAAPGWMIDDWIRQPADGVDVQQLRGTTVVMLCVQNNCRPSQLLALPMLADAADRFADADDVVLILHQTALTDFRVNTALNLRRIRDQLPPGIAVAHSGNARSRPVILDDYGIRGTPWTLIIGPDGIIEFSGCLVDSNELIRMVEELREVTAE